MRASQAVDEKVDGAVDDDEKPCDEVQEKSLLADVVILIMSIAELNFGDLSHLMQTKKKTWEVEKKKDQN